MTAEVRVVSTGRSVMDLLGLNGMGSTDRFVGLWLSSRRSSINGRMWNTVPAIVIGWPRRCRCGSRRGCGVGKVDSRCSGNEIGEDSFQAPGAGFSSAMNLPGEMTDFAFDLGSLRPVLGTPLRALLILFRF